MWADRTGLLALVAAALLALGTLACGAGDGAAPARDTGPPVDTAPVPHDVPVADSSLPPAPELVLGTTVAWAADPATFTPLADGDAMDLELGLQGLWMIVLAFKTRGLFTTDLTLTVDLSVADVSQGTLALTAQPLTAGGDGWFYYYNLFLIVMDPSIAGQAGTIHFTARDGAGHERTAELEVALTGGP